MGWSFWFCWVALSLLGFLLSLVFVEVGIRPHLGVFSGALGGAAIALGQWFVLRKYFSGANWWPIASILTWGLLGTTHLGAVGWIAPRSEHLLVRAIAGLIDGAQVGFFLGLGQWFVLRSLPKAPWWILIDTLAWAVGLSLGWTVGGIFYAIAHLFICEVFGLALAWTAIAGITGIAFVRLWRDTF